MSHTCRSPLLLDVKKVTYNSLSDSQKSSEEIEERALQALSEQAEYDIVDTNCEHFATWCVYGKKISGNVRAAATGSMVAGTTVAGGSAGVLIGGAVGSVVPIAGTIVGGFIGGAIGATAGAGLGATISGITTLVVHFKTKETKKL